MYVDGLTRYASPNLWMPLSWPQFSARRLNNRTGHVALPGRQLGGLAAQAPTDRLRLSVAEAFNT